MIEISSVQVQSYTSAVLKMTDGKGRTFFLRIDADRLVLNTKSDFTGRHAYVGPDDLFVLAKDQGRQPFGRAKSFKPKNEKTEVKLPRFGTKQPLID